MTVLFDAWNKNINQYSSIFASWQQFICLFVYLFVRIPISLYRSSNLSSWGLHISKQNKTKQYRPTYHMNEHINPPQIPHPPIHTKNSVRQFQQLPNTIDWFDIVFAFIFEKSTKRSSVCDNSYSGPTVALHTPRS